LGVGVKSPDSCIGRIPRHYKSQSNFASLVSPSYQTTSTNKGPRPSPTKISPSSLVRRYGPMHIGTRRQPTHKRTKGGVRDSRQERYRRTRLFPLRTFLATSQTCQVRGSHQYSITSPLPQVDLYAHEGNRSSVPEDTTSGSRTSKGVPLAEIAICLRVKPWPRRNAIMRSLVKIVSG